MILWRRFGTNSSGSLAAWKLLAVVALIGFTVAIFLDVASFGLLPGLGAHSLTSTSVLIQVKQLKQLVTVRYSLQRVVGLTEPRGALGEESILLMVQGEAQAGVDLASLRPSDIAFQGPHAVVIRLPKAKLFDTFIDEKQTKVWDRHITWWTPWIAYDPDLEHKARLSAIEDLRAAALQMGILAQAQKNAENAICDLLKVLNTDVTFTTQ